MRAEARVIVPGDAEPTTTSESERFLVERLPDDTVRVTIDRGQYVVQHAGTATAVRARLAVDADSRDRTAIDTATRNISGGGR